MDIIHNPATPFNTNSITDTMHQRIETLRKALLSKPGITFIYASTKEGAIGAANTLPWQRLSEDMNFFKTFTMNHIVAMGYNTFMSLKGPLNGRVNIVISKETQPIQNIPGVLVLNEEHLLKLSEILPIIVIGGAKTYRRFEPYCNYIVHSLVLNPENQLTTIDAYYHPNHYYMTCISRDYIPEYTTINVEVYARTKTYSSDINIQLINQEDIILNTTPVMLSEKLYTLFKPEIKFYQGGELVLNKLYRINVDYVKFMQYLELNGGKQDRIQEEYREDDTETISFTFPNEDSHYQVHLFSFSYMTEKDEYGLVFQLEEEEDRQLFMKHIDAILQLK